MRIDPERRRISLFGQFPTAPESAGSIARGVIDRGYVLPPGRHDLGVLFEDDDPRRRAHLLSTQGRSRKYIAEELGATEEAVDGWIAEAITIIREYQQAHPERLAAIHAAARPRITPEMRIEFARTLQDAGSGWGPILNVSLSEERGYTHNVYFNDLASTAFSDLVEESVELLRGDPRVEEARREDREVILLSAPGVSQVALLEELTSWWTQRLREVADHSNLR